MKITKIETYLLRCPVPADWKYPTASFVNGGSVFLKVSTDQGLVGWGEPSPYGATAETVLEVLHGGIPELFIGKDVGAVTQLTTQDEKRGEHLYGKAAWNCAIAGMSQALWDILGKARGQPLYRLLCGSDDFTPPPIRAYASGGMIFEDSPRLWLVDEAKKAKAEGYTAWKFRPTTPLGAASHFQRNLSPPPVNLPDLLEVSQKLRQELGPSFDLMLDLGCRIPSLDDALRLGRELSDLNFAFLEEPLPRDPKLYQALASQVKVPIAGGECFFSAAKFDSWIKAGALGILQPDANFAGITEILAIGKLARASRRPIVLHNWSSAISIAANVQLAAALPTVSMLEFNLTYNPLRTELVHEPFVPKKGVFLVGEKPGLGIEINEKALQRYSA